jgi:CheY-like chemotaxis protein
MNRPVTVLAADDDADDLALLRLSFERSGTGAELITVNNGPAVLGYLARAVAGEVAWPSIVLLDLKMPGMNGFDVLTAVQVNPVWKTIPVVIFSGSDQPVDVERAYDLGAARYLIKPQKLSDLMQVVRSIEMFCQRLPSRPPSREKALTSRAG